MKKEYDYTLSFLRLFATFCVIGLHSLQSIGQIPDSFPWFTGVPLFFIISGYLFGQARIDNAFLWYKKRLIRVYLPFLLLLLVNTLVILYYGKPFSVFSFIKTALLFPSATSDYIFGMGHCWYVTYIIIAYAMTPLLHRLLDCKRGVLYYSLAFVVVVAICQLTSFTPFFGKISFAHFILYLTAFAIGKMQDKVGREKNMCLSIFVGLLIYLSASLGGLIISNETFLSLLKLVGTNFLSLSFFGSVVYLFSKVSWDILPPPMLANTIQRLDHNSYYAYLTHIWFVAWGWWSVFGSTSLALTYAEYILLILISTSLFSFVSEQLIKIANRFLIIKN